MRLRERHAESRQAAGERVHPPAAGVPLGGLASNVSYVALEQQRLATGVERDVVPARGAHHRAHNPGSCDLIAHASRSPTRSPPSSSRSRPCARRRGRGPEGGVFEPRSPASPSIRTCLRPRGRSRPSGPPKASAARPGRELSTTAPQGAGVPTHAARQTFARVRPLAAPGMSQRAAVAAALPARAPGATFQRSPACSPRSAARHAQAWFRCSLRSRSS